MSTPIARTGPTSRVFKRQSLGQPLGGRTPPSFLVPAAPPPAASTKAANLERSLQLLDSAIGSPTTATTGAATRGQFLNLTGGDLSRMDEVTRPFQLAAAGGRSLAMASRTLGGGADVTRPINQSLLMNTSTIGGLQEENPGVRGTEALFDEFLTTMSAAAANSAGGGSVEAALDSIAEFEQMVADQVDLLRGVVVNVPAAKDKYPQTYSVYEDLTNESNTWRLMGKLYNDQLVTSQRPPVDLPPPAPGSEKQIIERLFRNNANIRQTHMVVQWLEKNAQHQTEETICQQMQWFTDATVGWENTLSALSRGQDCGANMVRSLDPDAPHRTGKQLHDLDQEDESRLLRCMYGLVRCGLLDEAQELCVRLGQPWRAATLEGWRLFHDPNYESGTNGEGNLLPAEGNKFRDIWKQVAWGLTEDSRIPLYERAIFAALCGNLQVLQSVCTSWEDLVWAGAKCAVDLMVETEIRDTLVKSFAPLPTAYWNLPQTLSKVMAEVAGRGGTVAQERILPYHIIQTHIILNDWAGLVSVMDQWLAGNIEPHLLRFMCHLVLVHRSLGLEAGDREAEERILRAYTQYLMDNQKLGLIPWYVSRLEPTSQLPLYSRFLTGVRDREDQQLCLYLGSEVGLDMAAITVAAVAHARQGDSPNLEEMVESLGWLSHSSDQAVELLDQTNAVIRRLLASGQLELATRAAGMVPKDTVARVAKAWREGEESGEGLPGGCVREHLALQVYLAAQEAFSDWFDHFHRGQPRRPVLADKPSFTDKVAHEQKEKLYAAELERWRGGQLIQARETEHKLREVLTFPGGWLLVEEEQEGDETEMLDEVEEERRRELTSLRQQLIPQTLALLHTVHHNTGQYKECLALADLVASDKHRLFTAFNKQQLRDLLKKIRESSLATMEKNCDAWGYPKP